MENSKKHNVSTSFYKLSKLIRSIWGELIFNTAMVMVLVLVLLVVWHISNSIQFYALSRDAKYIFAFAPEHLYTLARSQVSTTNRDQDDA